MGCVFAQAISLGIMVCKNIHWMWRACKRNEIEQENPILENPAKNMGVQKVMLHHGQWPERISQFTLVGCDIFVTRKKISISAISATSERVTLVPMFYFTKNRSSAPLFLLFRKKSRCVYAVRLQVRSRRFGLLPTFCGSRLRRVASFL